MDFRTKRTKGCSYTDARNADIDRLGKEYNKNIGKIETLRSIALEQEGCLLEFTREQELKDLQEKYESISMNFDIGKLIIKEGMKNNGLCVQLNAG